MESILDFSKPLDVGVLDQAAKAFYMEGNQQIGALITAFQNHPDAWTRADTILEHSTMLETRMLAANILLETCKSRWKILPPEQRQGIKTYLVNLIIKLSSDAKTLVANKTFLTKLNSVLVQIVKHEWPEHWPNFIPELVNSSKTSQSICANNMNILKLLSEEVFDYSSATMTQEKMRTMKKNLNKDFVSIFQLIEYILDHSTDPLLLTSTLQTLLKFLHWIPVGYIFETKLIQTLCLKFFPVAQFQNDTLMCLSEIGGLQLKDESNAAQSGVVTPPSQDLTKYNGSFVSLFLAVMTQVCKLITPETDVAAVYATGNPSAQIFLRHLAIFLTSFLKAHIGLVENENDATRAALGQAINILLRISRINDDDIFKIVLEYWNILVTDLYNTQRLHMAQHGNRLFPGAGGGWGGQQPGLTPVGGLLNSGLSSNLNAPRLQMYLKSLSELRLVLISKMAKPEEVLIVEDENGEIVRAPMKDTDAITLYKSMRECFPEDQTRVLTDKGFAFLDEIEARIEAGEQPLYACYSASSKSIEYCRGELYIPHGQQHELINFTEQEEAQRWNEADNKLGSDISPVGVAIPSLKATSSRLSLLVTRNHDMYVQTGSVSHDLTSFTATASKLKASELLPSSCSSQCTDECEHRRAALRFTAVAENGATSICPASDDALLGEIGAPLALSNASQLHAFLTIYGYWLGAGSSSSSCDGVLFSAPSSRIAAFLHDLLPAAGLSEEEYSTMHIDGQRMVCVTSSRWCEYLEQQSRSHFCSWVLNSCDKKQLRLILSGLHHAEDQSATSTPNTLHTSSHTFRDELLVALLHAGYSAHFERAGDMWRVCFTEPDNAAAAAAAEPSSPSSISSACHPILPRHGGVSTTKYTGRVWCVSVDHPDHLIFAQRAERDAEGMVSKASQPVVVGQCLIYLTHLDPADAQETMLRKLDRQMDGSEWSWANLNCLCWAIGSISGALSEQQEKTFLVRVIRDLLGLCEQKRGKDHKAVIASNIMYVVGQYPRFLRQHWRFLKTVVNKLFEFMHETHPGVQDMSVDTFLKIARKCRKKFVTIQPPAETRPFIDEILEGMQNTIKDLEPGQIHVFYEAVGEIIACETDPNKRQQLVFKLMELPNMTWSNLIAAANHDPQTLFDPATVKRFILVLKTNNRVAGSLGAGYIVQLARIYVDMLQVYKMYSNYVSMQIAEKGVIVTRTAIIRSMRSVKKETLNLIRTFITNSQELDRDVILNNFLPQLLAPVLDDFSQNVPDARDAEVLLLFAEIINKLGASMVPSVPRIFESVFQQTLDMITKNFEDYPDHRIHFFRLLEAINRHAFPALLRLNAQQFQLVMDSVIWAMKHLERNIADTGLQILYDLINNMQMSEVANDFYKAYFISLLQDILGVLTDTFHKPGFRLQALILAKLFNILETGAITTPLWVNAQNPNPSAFPNNMVYVRQFVCQLLLKAFPNLTPQQVDHFVVGLFTTQKNVNEFKTHLRDFLVQIKEFTGAGNEDLFLEEKRAQEAAQQQQESKAREEVPGLAYNPQPIANIEAEDQQLQ